jgi:hypothetical protein
LKNLLFKKPHRQKVQIYLQGDLMQNQIVKSFSWSVWAAIKKSNFACVCIGNNSQSTKVSDMALGPYVSKLIPKY